MKSTTKTARLIIGRFGGIMTALGVFGYHVLFVPLISTVLERTSATTSEFIDNYIMNIL